MFKQNYSSSLLEEAVDQFSSLPGIGRKTALRLALHLLKQPKENVERFSRSFTNLKNEVKFCPVCNMIADGGLCPICNDRTRDHSLVCVVESLRDVLSIENTGQYRGLYHILGGIISPMDGVGPSDLHIRELIERIKSEGVKEVLLALNTGMEGETTSFYIYKQISSYPIDITTIARGVGFGDDLEYTDELTLGRSIQNRQIFKP
ncbi:MAG: recombination mediator RecR [Bacteroidales bacterium]|nr:recombination mediator RecR [Bacteroidales bacterium]MDD4670633.1 recombination mediator RecR [Bacteroidales bacterium]